MAAQEEQIDLDPEQSRLVELIETRTRLPLVRFHGVPSSILVAVVSEAEMGYNRAWFEDFHRSLVKSAQREEDEGKRRAKLSQIDSQGYPQKLQTYFPCMSFTQPLDVALMRVIGVGNGPTPFSADNPLVRWEPKLWVLEPNEERRLDIVRQLFNQILITTGEEQRQQWYQTWSTRAQLQAEGAARMATIWRMVLSTGQLSIDDQQANNDLLKTFEAVRLSLEELVEKWCWLDMPPKATMLPKWAQDYMKSRRPITRSNARNSGHVATGENASQARGRARGRGQDSSWNQRGRGQGRGRGRGRGEGEQGVKRKMKEEAASDD